MDGAAEARRRPNRDVHVVDAVIEASHRFECLILRQSLFVGFGSRNAHAHHEAVGHFGADIGYHLAQKAQAAVPIAAVGIVAQIDSRIQKLRRQIAVAGDDLHAVEACRLHAARSVAVATDDGIEQRLFQRPRHHVEAFVRHGRGRVGDVEQPAIRFGHLSAGMEELPE